MDDMTHSDWETGFVTADDIDEARRLAADLTGGDFDMLVEIAAARRIRHSLTPTITDRQGRPS